MSLGLKQTKTTNNKRVCTLGVQVRSDCPPQRLLEFMAGEAGLAANETAESVASSKAQEEALLEEVRSPGPAA